MPEEVFVEPKLTNWPKIILAAVLGLGLLAGSAYAGYYYGTQQAQLEQEPFPEGISPPPEPSTLYLYCQSDTDCFWYQEMRSDPAGKIHCAGVNYQETCASCKKLSVDMIRNLPENWKCFCNPSLDRCIENR